MFFIFSLFTSPRSIKVLNIDLKLYKRYLTILNHDIQRGSIHMVNKINLILILDMSLLLLHFEYTFNDG